MNSHLKVLPIILMISFQVKAAVSNTEGAGMCVGFLTIASSQYKVAGAEIDNRSRTVYTNYYKNLERLQPTIMNCLKGSADLEKQKICISNLPSKFDQDFYTGAMKGIAFADDSYNKGGKGLLKLNGELICTNIK